ncbi:PRELI/MSF1 domain-containing protein [Lasiodiplodia theobromae]|uniref:PRELI domain-containing protein 1 n=3 Tax=Lasiodiplodia TaxID=66739 RepID=A0A5N5DPG9_9PEZI|nr:PRELI domain-containing protein 1 [Lasiodiplodia theobromae]KAF9638716.1 PRELI/MSF1 domain-containing protein [Lasiodiplodia theobromae]KAK0660752.1 PRELI domain-containing protein 1 [Lasiodiplodia hormozganensis]
MVKFYDSSYSYDYSFPAVTLAYFLRYPNPYSTHVLSTDVIERRFDPDTQELHTVRLHLKRSKLPAAVLKILPRSLLGASSAGDTQSYILEHSVVNIREGWMDTVSQNLEWTGVLSVVERQLFRRPTDIFRSNKCEKSAAAHGLLDSGLNETTEVKTSVTLHSKIGENIRKRRAAKAAADAKAAELDEEQPPKVGFFKSWSTASIQRSIELIGLKRAEKSQPNAKEGMKIVLQRMRQGGLVAVLEGMRQDREKILMGRNANDVNDRS